MFFLPQDESEFHGFSEDEISVASSRAESLRKEGDTIKHTLARARGEVCASFFWKKLLSYLFWIIPCHCIPLDCASENPITIFYVDIDSLLLLVLMKSYRMIILDI